MDKLKSIDDILHRISCMDQAETEEELALMIPGLLGSIGEYSDADRVYIFEWDSNQHKSMSNTYEWCDKGVIPEMDNLQGVPALMMPRWIEIFERKENVIIRRLEKIAETMPNEYSLLKPQNIQSLIAVPIYAGRMLKGFIGIDNPDVYSDTLSIRILADVGGHLGSIQENMKMFRMLKAERENLRRTNLLLSGLSLDYTTIFTLNLDTDAYEIMSNTTARDELHDESIHRKLKHFAQYVQWYADKFVIPDFQEAVKVQLNSASIMEHFASLSDYHFYYEALPNEAGETCFQVHFVRKYDEEGHFAILGIRSVDEAVEKEKHYKQLLQNQLDMITFALPGGVKISMDDEMFSFKYVSKPFSRMLGYETSEELIEASGGSMVGLIHPEDLDKCRTSLNDQYSRQNNYAINYRARCKDGSYKYIEDCGKLVKAEDGSLEHWSLLLDKNDLMEKTIELESARQASRSKSAFLSRMSHDMRTPLNGIVGLLKIDAAHPEDRALVDGNREKMQVAADHLLSLINDVLQMSKIEDGSVSLTHEKINLREMFQEVITIIEERAKENRISLEFELKGSHTPDFAIVYGSPLHLRQIFLNIFGNAVKYNRPGGRIFTTIDYSECDGIATCCWTISDTGIGMKPEFLKHIFEPFTQEKQDARSVYQGTGLGMAIAKGLVEQMKGSIDVYSKENVGTTFVITIPFELAKDVEEVQENQEETNLRLDGVRLLVAEDNELNAEIAEFLLSDEGAQVTLVENGQKAVDMFQSQPPGSFDLILMDIMMPQMDGHEATRTIRALDRPDAKTIPIIAMTANAFAEDREKCLAAGMNDHLTKPLDLDKIVEKILFFK